MRTAFGLGLAFMLPLLVAPVGCDGADSRIPGAGGTVAVGAGFVWATVYGTPLTKIDAVSNALVKQWFGPGGDARTFGYGSVWLANHQAGVVWRINPAGTGSTAIRQR